MGSDCRKVHFEEIASPGHRQLSAPACMKPDALPRPISAMEEDKSARQGCMAAKCDFGGGSEPSKVKAFGIRDKESRIREVVLYSNGLKDRVVEPAI